MADTIIAAIRIRGSHHMPAPIRDALAMLHLDRVNTCVLVKATPSTLGMLRKVKDYVTYGTADEAVAKALAAQKNALSGEHKLFLGQYRLNPPRKGFARKGIKVAFANGGALGNRKEKINDLVLRMVTPAAAPAATEK